NGIHGGLQLKRLAVAKGGGSRIRAVRDKIKDENVVLMFLQRRYQRQQLVLAGFIAVAKNNRGRTAEAGEKPALAMPAGAWNFEFDRFRPAGETLQVDLGTGAARFDDAIDQKAGDGQGSESGKKDHGNDSREQLGVPLCRVAELEEN